MRIIIICLLLSGCAMNAHHRNTDINYVNPGGLTGTGEYSVVPTTNGVEVTAKFSEYQFLIDDNLSGWAGCVNVLNMGAAEYAAKLKKEGTRGAELTPKQNFGGFIGVISLGRDPFTEVMNVNCRHTYTFNAL